MNKPQAFSREQLEGNIKISHNWMTAVRAGTYKGHEALHIATLLDFLQKQHDQARLDYEAESLQHPEWGKDKKIAMEAGVPSPA